MIRVKQAEQHMDMEKRKRLDRMFNPRGFAIFGSVGTLGAFGNSMVLSHIKYGYQGKIYPISRKGGEVAGLKVYKSLADVEGPVDLASVSVPAAAVPEVLQHCLEHGVAGAEIHSSGFSETGEKEGRTLQEEIAKIAGKGLAIVGPNCFGLHSPKGGITLLPAFDFSKIPGPVAMISQSGGVANDFGHEARLAGLGISKIISFGNGCGLGAVELLEYLEDDPDTAYIAAYIEGVNDGRSFFEAIRKITSKKPLVIWKGGLTPLGARAALSHTGSLGGETTIWRCALKQAKAILVEGIDEMIDTLIALTYIKSRGSRIALVGGGGAIGVFSSDLAFGWGLEIPTFSKETQKALKRFFPAPGNSVLNPLDTGTPALPLDSVKGCVKEILLHEPIDILVLIMLLHPLEIVMPAFMEMAGLPPISGGDYLKGLLETLLALKEETGKDIALVLENRTCRIEDAKVESILRELREQYQSKGIPVYENTENALRGIKNVSTAA